MVVSRKIKEYLDNNGVEYKVLIHPTAYTAQEIAAATHVSGKELAKAIMVNADGRMVMVVLPSTHKIDFDKIKQALNAKKVNLATEEEFRELFPDCEIGAQPPFGNLYNVDVLAADSLAKADDITFNAGTHTDVITIHRSDWERLVKPGHAQISERLT